MTFDDWGQVLRIAATIWPQSRSFFDDPPGAGRTPTRTWWVALCRFETDDVLAAIGRLGMSSRFWPSLAELVEATRQVIGERRERERRAAQDATPRLAAPGQGTVLERLAVFDQMSALAHWEHEAELRRFAAHAGEDLEAGHLAGGDTTGHWERRLRELIATGDWPEAKAPGRSGTCPWEEQQAPESAPPSRPHSGSLGAVDASATAVGTSPPNCSTDERKVWAPRTSHSRPGRAAGVPRGHGRFEHDGAEQGDGAAGVARFVPRPTGGPAE
jgi:hypothetical protein